MVNCAKRNLVFGMLLVKKEFGQMNLIFVPHDHELSNAGILASRSLFALINSEGQDNGKQRASFFNKKFFCHDPSAENVHDFSDLLSKELQNNLNKTYLNKQRCSVCHVKLDRQALFFSGWYVGTSFESWLQTKQLSEYFYLSNKKLTSVEGFTAELQKDSRLTLCEVKNLLSSYLRKDIDFYKDRKLILSMHKYFKKNNFSVKKLVYKIIKDQSYSTAWGLKSGEKFFLSSNYKGSVTSASNNTEEDIGDRTKVSSSRTSSIRFLKVEQLLAILSALMPANKKLNKSYWILNQQVNNLSFSVHTISSDYFRFTYELAVDFSKQIVGFELSEGRLASSRFLFTKLPDGAGLTNSYDIWNEQLFYLYLLFTGRSLSIKEDQYVRLKKVFDDALTHHIDEAEANQFAWSQVLVAVLMSPEFLTY